MAPEWNHMEGIRWCGRDETACCHTTRIAAYLAGNSIILMTVKNSVCEAQIKLRNYRAIKLGVTPEVDVFESQHPIPRRLVPTAPKSGSVCQGSRPWCTGGHEGRWRDGQSFSSLCVLSSRQAA